MAELLSLMGRLLLVVVLFAVSYLVYNVFFHPLRSYPGPWYATMSSFWFLYRMGDGSHYEAVHRLHLKYGPVVRIAPNELSFIEPEAWKDIYGHGNKPEFSKDPTTSYTNEPAYANILMAPTEKHATLRRILSPAFSDRAMRGQEAILSEYTHRFVEALGRCGSDTVDMVRWYNYMTFDIFGHLAFSESFDCLSKSAYHPWVGMIFSSIRFMAWTRSLGRLGISLIPLLLRFIPEKTMREYRANNRLTAEKLARRRDKSELAHADFAEHLLRAERDGALHTKDLLSNLPLLVIAGSETTASALAGATYYLLATPHAYRRLVGEIRSRFASHDEATLPRINELKYLAAVIHEALRVYPPANSNHPRVVPPGGRRVCGRFVPGNMLVGVPQWACFRSPLNFARPDEFVPERFLGESPEFADDRRDALQPFHVGPRNCIGRKLADTELRLILTHLLLEFDFELQPESRDWNKQQVFVGPVKPPLMVKLRAVRKS